MNHYPFLNPHAAAQQAQPMTTAYEDKATAQQQFNKIVEEVMSKKNKEKMHQNSTINSCSEQERCSMHPTRPSKTCRQCRKIAQEAREEQPATLQESVPGAEDKHTKASSEHFALNCEMALSHFNEKLKKNVQGFDYFRDLYALRTVSQVVDQIDSQCKSIQTFQKGSTEIPTKFMCCFYKLVLMRLGAKDIHHLLQHANPYVKVAGLLYIRMLCAYQHLYDWLSPFLSSQQSTAVNNSEFFTRIDKSEELSVGQYVRRLLTELDHYQLRLPRIPIKIDRDIQSRIASTKLDAEGLPKNGQTESGLAAETPKTVSQVGLGIVAVAILNGKKTRLKVKELAERVFAWHPESGQLVELDYQQVDLEDQKQQSQQVQKNVANNSVVERKKRSRSRSRAERRQVEQRSSHRKSDSRHKHSKRRDSSSSSSASSSRSRKRSPRPSKAGSGNPQKQTSTTKDQLNIVPSTHSSINSLKASIKQMAAASQDRCARAPEEPNPHVREALAKYREGEAETGQSNWRDPALEQDNKEQVIRMG